MKINCKIKMLTNLSTKLSLCTPYNPYLLSCAVVWTPTSWRAFRSVQEENGEKEFSNKNTHVVIVGAGTAGLTAANHLNEHGIKNITVLEALDRPGGRIYSSWFADSIIELGSVPTTTPKPNPILADALNDGLFTPQLNKADRTRGLLLKSDGGPIPYPLTYKVYHIFKEIMEQAKQIDQSGQSRESLMHFVGSRIQQEIRAMPDSDQDDAARIFHGLVCLACLRSNHDTNMMVRTESGDFIQLPGSDIQVPLGYFGEIHYLHKALPQNQVLFNKLVSKIRWGGVPDIFPRAVVICEDGDEYPADYVIITIPLGVLKKVSETLFCPELPATKLDAILKIPVGQLDKIYLEFSKPFWMWKKDFFQGISFNQRKMESKYPDSWLKGLVSIAPVPGSNHIMMDTVAGPQALCMQSLTDEQIIEDKMNFLKGLFCKRKIPEPVNIKRTRWASDPHFYGSHSYIERGVSYKDFNRLASPLPELCDPVLLFAGEATCPVHYGTVAGAKGSGIREAERLLQLLRLKEENNYTQLKQVHVSS